MLTPKPSLISTITEKNACNIVFAGEAFGQHVKPISADTHREQQLMQRYPVVHSCSKDKRWLIREDVARITHIFLLSNPDDNWGSWPAKQANPSPIQIHQEFAEQFLPDVSVVQSCAHKVAIMRACAVQTCYSRECSKHISKARNEADRG